MFFNEGIAIMLIAKPLKVLTNDYSIKAYLIYAITSFVILVLTFKILLNKLQVESILKLKGFYTVYAAVLAAITAAFVNMNYFTESIDASSLDKDPFKIQEKTRENFEIDFNKKLIETKSCQSDPLCDYVKKTK